MLVTTKELYLDAKQNGYAVGAFNVSSLEAIRAALSAATIQNANIVIETSENEMNYLEPEITFAIVRTIADKLPIKVGLHLDHGKSIDIVKKAIEAGYTSVHIDGSSLSFDENLKITKEVVEYAHGRGITVEGEIGHVPGSSVDHGEQSRIDRAMLTDIDQAKRFVSETGIDILAVSIGNIHGVYANAPILDLERLKGISEIGIPMSLHGGSGISADQIRKAISLGITKVNVNTELRMAFTKTMRRELCDNSYKMVPYEYLPEIIDAIGKIIIEKIELFKMEGFKNG